MSESLKKALRAVVRLRDTLEPGWAVQKSTGAARGHGAPGRVPPEGLLTPDGGRVGRGPSRVPEEEADGSATPGRHPGRSSAGFGEDCPPSYHFKGHLPVKGGPDALRNPCHILRSKDALGRHPFKGHVTLRVGPPVPGVLEDMTKHEFIMPNGLAITSLVLSDEELEEFIQLLMAGPPFASGHKFEEKDAIAIRKEKHIPLIVCGTVTQHLFEKYCVSTDWMSVIVRGEGPKVFGRHFGN